MPRATLPHVALSLLAAVTALALPGWAWAQAHAPDAADDSADVDEDRARQTLVAGGGAVVGSGFDDFSTNHVFGVGYHVVWKTSSMLGVGLRETVRVTELPYGNYDGEPSVGQVHSVDTLGRLTDEVTVMPSTMLTLDVMPIDVFSIDLAAGVTYLTSDALDKLWWLLPLPTAGLGVIGVIPVSDQVGVVVGAQADVALFWAQKEDYVFLQPEGFVGVSL